MRAEARDLLGDCPEGVRRHAEAVAEYAVDLAEELGADEQLVETGALLHDVGRCRTAGLEHVAAGAEMVRERLGEEVAALVRSHVGAGLTPDEAEEAGLPEGDYMPGALEQRIVAYADNRFAGERFLDYEEALDRFRGRLGRDHPAVERFEEMHRELRQD